MRTFLTYLTLVLITIAPILSVAIAGGIAGACGCQLDEGNEHPCIVLGVDIGGVLYAMGVAGWFMLLTIPLGLVAILMYTDEVMERRKRTRAAANDKGRDATT